MAKGTIVIDPGHGGSLEVGGSSANNAASPSGVLEKNMTLRLGLLVRDALQEAANIGNHNIKVVMTRETDKNLGLAQRANVAKTNKADLFLSIHFNASVAHNARGVETLVRPKSAGNINHAEDTAFAERIQKAVFNAVLAHDANTRNRKVKDQVLGVLKDSSLGSGVRACLVEVEFIDVKAVDELLNLSPNAAKVRSDIAAAISTACIDELKAINP
jgi:N-acetylmuramoyl-L-alanine amidase